jgi:DNA-binding response OmpR family regulator
MAGYPARKGEALKDKADGGLAASRIVLVALRDASRAGEIVGTIQARGLPAVQAASARQAVFWSRVASPALTLLDLGVDRSRMLLGELRREGRAVVAVSDDPQARTWALEVGCLDAIQPSVEPEELALKLSGLVHGRHLRRGGRITAGALTIDLSAGRLLWKGEDIVVSPLLLDLAAYLAARPGQLTPAPVLLEEVWGEPWASLNKVHQTIWRLRKYLREPLGSSFLVGRRGYGYGMFPEASPNTSIKRAI